MDEFQRIARLSSLFARPGPELLVGIGDDCAVLAGSSHPRVWTVDSAVEGVHFDRAFMSLEAIGARAFMAAASDVAAMGARAVAALSALVLPSSLDDAELVALGGGIARAAVACECAIVGGNLARGGELSLTTSVLGECTGRFITRSGGKVGDRVYVTGPLGGAALGLALLQRGERGENAFTQAFLGPRARLDRSALMAASASAAIDVSDGLFADLAQLCRASAVGARIERARIPTAPGFARVAAELGLDATALIGGGEDYELLFTSSELLVPELAVEIGRLTEARELVLLDEQGQSLPMPQQGFDHFRTRPT